MRGSGLSNYREWANKGTAQPGPSAANHNGYFLGQQQNALDSRYPPQSFNTQMMSMQIRIMQARQINVKNKQMLARNIIESNHRMAQANSIAQQQQAPQPLQQRADPYYNGGYSVERQLPPQPSIQPESGLQHQRQNSSSNGDLYDRSRSARSDSRDGTRHAESDIDDAPERSKLAPHPQKPLHNHKLHALSEELNSAVGENSKMLTAAIDDQLPVDKRKQREMKAAQAKHRQDIESLLHNKPVAHEILPKWKHLKLFNNPNPLPNTVMKPIRLFRVVAWSVVHMITGPSASILRRRAKYADRDRKDFKRTLDLFMETVDDWMGKLISLPLASIVTDVSLDFDPKESYGKAALRTRMVQLKVRLKAVVQNICAAPMPSAHITTFLSSLITDGCYYPEGFLWACEQKDLSLDKLGATRGMLPEVDPLFASQAHYKVTVEEEGHPFKTIDVGRARMVLINFLMVRTLIYHLGLTPWQHGICAAPTNRNIRRTVLNLRVLCTLLYQLVRLISNDCLPALSDAITARAAAMSGKQPSDQSAAAEEDEVAGTKGLLKSVLKYAGFTDTPGTEVFKHDSVEFTLMAPKTANYCTLDHLHTLLLPFGQISGINQLSTEWLDELIQPLAGWLQKLMEHIVRYQFSARKKGNSTVGLGE